MKPTVTLLGMVAILAATLLLTACEQKPELTVRDEMGELLEQAILRLQKIPTPAQTEASASIEAPAIPSRVELRVAMGKADIVLFEGLLPAAQKSL